MLIIHMNGFSFLTLLLLHTTLSHFAQAKEENPSSSETPYKVQYENLSSSPQPPPSDSSTETRDIAEESSPENDDSALKTDENTPLDERSSQTIESIESHLEKLFDNEKERRQQEKEVQKAKESLFNPMSPPSLEDIHTSLSADIVDLSESVDTFFVNNRIIDGRNTTHLRVISSLSVIEREGLVDNVDFRLRFRLPRIEKKIQFEVNNLDNSLSNDSSRTTTVNTTRNTTGNQQQNTTAGFSFFKDVLGIQSKFTLGFIFRDFAPFGNFRLSKNILLSDKDNIMFISDVFGDTEERTGHRSTIYYDHSLTQRLLFRFFNESVYRHEFHSFETQHGIAFYHTLTDRHSIAHTAQVRSENPQFISSFYVRSYDLFSTFRYRAYKKHVFIDMIPTLNFPKEYDFKSNWSFTLRLEIIFGSV